MPESFENRNPINEVVGKMPSWMTRWGITIVFLIFTLIIIGCYFIKYPQTSTATIVITTLNPPAELIAKSSGKIERLFVQNGDSVYIEQPLALVENPANYDDILLIERLLLSCGIDSSFWAVSNSSTIEGDYTLGEIQETFSEFAKTCMAYRHYFKVDYIGKKQRLLEAQIHKSRQQYFHQQNQQLLYEQELAIADKTLKRDSTLHSQRVISSLDYEKSQQANLQKRETKASISANLAGTELSIMQTQQQIIELSIQKENEVVEFEDNIWKQRQQLLNLIQIWKETYLISSPINGYITFVNYWTEHQSIKSGESFASVLPLAKTQVIGRLTIPSSGFGKIQKGQTVNIKLKGFPYMEYGLLKGELGNISAVPDAENGYKADVFFPNGLVTTYNKTLPLIQQMDGSAEIITKDMRLIEQFWQPIRALFSR